MELFWLFTSDVVVQKTSKVLATLRIGVAATLALAVPVAIIAQDRAALNEMFLRAVNTESNDPAAADQLYEQAAKQGHTPSMVVLGYRLLDGIGEAQDRPRAFSLFTAAARAGNVDGKFLLGLAYLQGVGTQKNPAAARENLLDPATQGNQYAQYTLGIMLAVGEGGPKRESAARRWLDRAANGPHKDLAVRAADLRDKLDAKLFSPDDSTGKAVTALAFIVLVAAALGGGGSSGGGGVDTTSSPTGLGGSISNSSPPQVRPILHYPTNISKAVNGNLTDPGLSPW